MPPISFNWGFSSCKKPQTKSTTNGDMRFTIRNATAYVGCWTAETKIAAMKTVKTVFGEPRLAFDFICYNNCKQRSSDSICQKQCSLK